MRVGFLGPAGTYSEEALRASAPPGVEEVPCTSVYETVMAVQDGLVDRAVVPIENALEGGVAATLDALAGEADRVRIAGEVVHPIHHCLVAARAARARGRDERGVASPGERPVRPLPARAAPRRRARHGPVHRGRGDDGPQGGGTAAALGSRLAAELYDCQVLAENVEDRPDNVTRFVWLAPAGDTPTRARDAKTSIVFWGAGDESPGWLVEVLRQFADRGVNLTRIESRPRRVRLGHYMFFADLEGRRSGRR